MNSSEIRAKFKNFFSKNGHKIVPSDSMVIKGDPTLMFTNAGMNQFKDIFLGSRKPEALRVANSQKCLRVSGKHNDIEDVGHDTYHHTMFEMLGNWSFGDYFKEGAINYAWTLLTEEFKIDKDRLYVTVFGGDKDENISLDIEAEDIWKKYIDNSRILYGSKKDNFWEMGDMGPCGPCSEIHVDIRNDKDRKEIPGQELVNKDHPQVIEIWNLVFIQFNRKADGSLEQLPERHVDTGMGFERLCTVLQGKKSNYDTDIFQTIIKKISEISGITYGDNEKTDIALRVVADHLRAVSFAIADGQLPSNVKAGYVIRRILRRAVRYAYSFLDMKEAFIYKLVPTLAKQMGDAYPELISQQNLIEKVIKEEETTFLRTLEKGIRLLDQNIGTLKASGKNEISGNDAFLLYDTYGFPFDLTELIAKENGMTVNKKEFDSEMQKQKDRARNASDTNTDDWTIIGTEEEIPFIGYDFIETNIHIIKYRQVKQKNENIFHLIFDRTPFYAESGGQIGDTGYIKNGDEKIFIENTIKEHNQIIHITKKLPENTEAEFNAVVDFGKRDSTAKNHSATHLLHYALRSILGTHVEQKGSLVDSKKLRFDFSHFNKLTDEEIRKVEIMVNSMIVGNNTRNEQRNMNIDEAKNMGAISLFGEKYGDKVRVIQFGDSIELCGGTHVENTGQIGFFKIISESAIAAGIRRIEAITGIEAENYIFEHLDLLSEISKALNNPKDVLQGINKLISENNIQRKQLENYRISELKNIKKEIIKKSEILNNITIISEVIDLQDPNDLKEICSQIRGEIQSFACILGTVIDSKPYLAIAFSENLTQEKELNAGQLIREAAKPIQGGGGGQAFIATAGGKDPEGIKKAVDFAKDEILKKIY
ncbi:MAG: alanine--tRNA ligase [Bacteroidales bacterium]|jgi:alanyl-tRNA synthetase|nr:alanine--tRNA ligase [Bacteroidales bacterium]